MVNTEVAFMSHNIAVIGGDGTGPEVIAEGLKVLKAAASKFNIKFDFHHFDFGGERFLKTGKIISKEEIEELRKFDAIYLGAMIQGGMEISVVLHVPG